ncbi:hypothetical protein MLD52_21390 [Puniceicoccaceae bacterium K14]|nr:hypothetical protein [Puniceicoccaceae bacterium K14]
MKKIITAVLIAIGLSSYALAGEVSIEVTYSGDYANVNVPYGSTASLYAEVEGGYSWAAIYGYGGNTELELESFSNSGLHCAWDTGSWGSYDLDVYCMGVNTRAYASISW